MLRGSPLQYLIGVDDDEAIEGEDDVATVMPFDRPPAAHGLSIGYCNLLSENKEPKYGPFLEGSDTARKYKEGQMEPSGSGWLRSLSDQLAWRQAQGYEYIELDNADSYPLVAVLRALTLAQSYGLKVIAKNPMAMASYGDALIYMRHPNIYGVIVERNCGYPAQMDGLRRRADKPNMMVWFVGYGQGETWAYACVNDARHFSDMGVSYSRKGEYESCEILLRPQGC